MFKFKEYSENHKFWQDKAIQQLSFTNNLLLTISIGFLSFSFNKDLLSNLKFTLTDFNLSITFYSLSLLSIVLAVGFGFIMLLTRLYDMRLTRHKP